MGGLRQAAFRRARAGLGLRRSLYPSRGHFQSAALGHRGGQRELPLQGLSHDAQQKTMTLQAEEFIRRFLLHVLPDGFQRIRYYGFLANRYREQKLARCRELLGMPTPNRQPWKPPRTIVNAMKNSPALRCGSAQSAAKAACW